MERRPSRSNRRRRRKTSSGPGPTPRTAKTLRPAGDGKVNIFCPQCGAGYRIQVDAIDTRVECRHCHRVFNPRATHGARRRQGPGAATFVWIAAGVAVLILIGVVIKSVASPLPTRTRTAAQPKPPELGLSNPRVRAIRTWAEAIAAGDAFSIEYGSDLGALQTFLGVEADRNFTNAYAAERAKLTARIRTELTTGEQTRLFRELRVVDANLTRPEMAESEAGTALLRLEPIDRTTWASGGVVKVAFRMDGLKPVVTGWEVVRAPERIRVAETSDSEPEPADPTDPGIAAPVRVSAITDERSVTILESELVPLGHLADTSSELAAEIDRLIDNLLDLDAPGPVSNQAIDRLDEIGKPAVPRLLNQLHALSDDVEGNNFKLIRVDRALRAMTGRAFGYDTMGILKGDRLQEQRISALKQWYAWWYRNHDRAHDLAIDKQDGPPPVKIKK